ncbi:lipopolysaccharide biosynthesis protein [Gracilibacillus sp. JCM 18860]|uniref:oligosaccharide flippase family protein n=1 Tax=Gracilibacillus sp. JCM 18860 TaxID=1306159 RepID=UPI0006D0AD2A
MEKNKIKSNSAIIGLFWSFTELVSKQGISILIQIVLARLLLPEHFGLIGMITIFVAISTSLVQSGLDQALIREKEVGQQDYSTVFYFNLVVAVFIYLIIFFTAPIIALFYGESELVLILRVLMLVIIINSMSVIQRVILVRNIDFKAQTKITVISNITSGIIAVLLAFLGAGVWSLVSQQLVAQTLTMLLLLLTNRWIPSFTFNTILFKRYFNFGYKLLLASLINVIQKNIYHVVIGKVFPTTQLGYYTNAAKLREISAQSLSQALQRVTYPVLSRNKDNISQLSKQYERLIRSTGFIHFPLITLLAVTSPIFIPLLLGGERWEPVVPFFQLLCIIGALYPIQSLNLNVLNVIGRTDIFLILSLIKVSIHFSLLGIGIYNDFSIEGLIVIAIVNSYIALLIHCYVTSRYINYTFIRQLFHLGKLLLSVVILYIIVNTLSGYLVFNPFINLAIQIISGLLVYILLSIIMNNWELKSAISLINSRKN